MGHSVVSHGTLPLVLTSTGKTFTHDFRGHEGDPCAAGDLNCEVLSTLLFTLFPSILSPPRCESISIHSFIHRHSFNPAGLLCSRSQPGAPCDYKELIHIFRQPGSLIAYSSTFDPYFYPLPAVRGVTLLLNLATLHIHLREQSLFSHRNHYRDEILLRSGLIVF